MNKMIEQAKALRKAAYDLEEAAENQILPDLQERYKNIVGMCFELKNSSGEDRWMEYFKISKIDGFHNVFESPTISVECQSFSLNHPYYGVHIVEREHSYFHVLQEMGKPISREKYNKKLEEAVQKIS